jgi:hypothetical protein
MSGVHGTRVGAAIIAMIAATWVMSQGAGAETARSLVTHSHSHSHLRAYAPAACGAQAPETLAQAAGLVATRIYAGEVSSSEVQSDKREVEEYAPLLSAVESGEQTATEAAVKNLVYSGTHIVRLRVSKGSTLLADVGGPYILAPVSGVLQSHGRAIAHYELSVQDDLGYVKLETRFIGAPLVLRVGAHDVPVEGLVTPGPASIPEHGPVHYRGIAYQAFSFEAGAYPSGVLRISLLVPLPSGIAEESCAAVRAGELGLIAQRISEQFPLSPGDFSTYVKLAQGDTGALLYVRSGADQLAGSTVQGPSKLPSSGRIRFGRAGYEVSSFEAQSSVGPVRVYVLVRS